MVAKKTKTIYAIKTLNSLSIKVQRNNINETVNKVLSIKVSLLKKKPDIKEDIDKIIITVLNKV